ncbi:MAG: heavy metal translocating P-type ATPase [Candidatus Cloacimonetes bacterium]|nr:heavy metal translocating P-type ATPase [Candidatus Cloacimonadota bacterium]
MQKYIFLMNNLTCAGCASEIERALRSKDWVTGLTLDFLGRELTLFVNRKFEEQELLTLIDQIIKKIEPEVETVIISHKEKEYRFRDSLIASLKTGEILFSLLGLLIFVSAILVQIPALKITGYLVSYLIIGREVIKGAIRKLWSRYLFNEHLLMTIATLGAIFIGEYMEAVAVMLFYQIGRYFESKIVEYSQHSIEQLQKLKPEYANLIKDNQTVRVLPEQVEVNELIIVKPGERVPLDGIIMEGFSNINNALLTGESFPETVKKGTMIKAGAINLDSSLTIKVTSKYDSSTISHIVDLIRSAKSRKAKTERFISRFAQVYTPVVLALAMLIALIPPFVLSSGSFTDWFYRALIFLVISCPCALVISVPLSFFGGLAVLVKNGVLVKGGIYIENLAKTKTIVLDKTGTLTLGKIAVTKINPVPGTEQRELLYNAYLAESHSNHPIALAVFAEFHRLFSNHDQVDINQVNDYNFSEVPGLGVKVSSNDLSILVGRLGFLKSEGILIPNEITDNDDNKTMIGVAKNNMFLGTIHFADSLRNKIPEMIDKLKRWGIKRIIMLTGDREDIATALATSLGIREYYANLLPEDKLRFMDTLKNEEKGKVLFIGDGINDAPAMALADTGIAMGGIGSSVAIESSDVVLQTDEIERLPNILEIAHKTLNNARQNIVIALGIKGIFLLLGSLGLITIWGAVFADVGVTILAVMNSLRLLKYRRNYRS